MAGLRVVAAWGQVGGTHRGRACLFTHSVTLLWSEVLYTFLYRWYPKKLKVKGVLRIGAQALLGVLSNGFNLAAVALFRPPGYIFAG